MLSSIDIDSSMPCSAHLCDGSSSRRVDCSTSGSEFGVSPYTLFVEQKMKVASGQCLRVASSSTRVPFAFTLKSVKGSRAAQSCDGCAAVWMTALIEAPWCANSSSIVATSRTSTSRASKFARSCRNRSTDQRVDASGPKNCARMSLSRPTTRSARLENTARRGTTDQPACTCDDDDIHVDSDGRPGAATLSFPSRAFPATPPSHGDLSIGRAPRSDDHRSTYPAVTHVTVGTARGDLC